MRSPANQKRGIGVCPLEDAGPEAGEGTLEKAITHLPRNLPPGLRKSMHPGKGAPKRTEGLKPGGENQKSRPHKNVPKKGGWLNLRRL